MTLDNEQIVRQAYKMAENKDLEGWVVPPATCAAP